MTETAAVYRGITLDGAGVEVNVAGGMISAVKPVAVEPGMPRILPVLVDLQQNGALGCAFNMMKDETAGEQLAKIGGHLLNHGVGRVLATFPTAHYDALDQAAAAIGEALEKDAVLDRLYAGIFHEGVFISPDQGWRGGHRPENIMPPDWEKFARLNRLSGNRVRLVNVAPEVPGALAFIENAAAAGITVALGHCHPDTATIREAARCGASMVTHFANGAAPEIHRFKNPFWGFMAEDGLALGLVGDGFHLPPEVAQVALKVKGAEKCFMVSDANIYSGCAPGVYKRVGGMDCQIEPDGFIHVVNSEILAGAWFQNDRCVEYLVTRVGIDFETAWRMCSTIPAKLAKIDLPELRTGAEASFVIASCENGKPVISKTVFCGKEYIAG